MIAEEGSLDGSDTETLKSSPMSQRDFYQHVSGSGEGQGLGTTASPLMKQMVMSPLASVNSYGFEIEEPEMESNKSSNFWSEKMREFQHQLETLLGSVDKDKVDVAVGRSALCRNQPVYLDSNVDELQPGKENNNEGDSEPDGLLVYLSIRFKKEFQDEAKELIQGFLKQSDPYSNRDDEDGERSSPDGKNSEHFDEKAYSQTDEEEDGDDIEGSNGIKRRSKKSPGSVKSRSPRDNNADEDDGQVQFEEYQEEVVNEDGSIQLITKRRIKAGTTGRSHGGQEGYSEYLDESEHGRLSRSGKGGHFGDETAAQRRERLRERKLQNLNKRYGRSLSPPEWGRHESCFEEFDVFDDDYDGPKGILTSRLPDGTSTLDYDPLYVPSDDPSIQIRRIGNMTYRSHDPIAGLTYTSRMLPECSTPFKSSLGLQPQGSGSRLLSTRAPQVPNRIRRLRSRHVEFDRNVWFVGSTPCSFNSRCSARFDLSELEPNSRQYYYFRSLPRLAHQESSEGSFNSTSESPRRRRRPDNSLEELLL